MQVSVSVFIDAPPDRVWMDVSDLQSHGEWMQDAESVEVKLLEAVLARLDAGQQAATSPHTAHHGARFLHGMGQAAEPAPGVAARCAPRRSARG